MTAIHSTPFTILVDAAEKAPFSFTGMSRVVHSPAGEAGEACDAEIPVTVRAEYRSLGPGMGDYTLDGFQPTPGTKYTLPSLRGCISIERKSANDFRSTILGWGEHRNRFERELGNLAQMKFAAVVVECPLGRMLDETEQWGKRSAAENRHLLECSVQAWMQRYPTMHWIFCEDRRQAEEWTYRLLERFWEYEVTKCRRSKRQRKRVTKALGRLF